MPYLALGLLGVLGLGATGGYIAGVKTSNLILAGAVLAGGWYIMKGKA